MTAGIKFQKAVRYLFFENCIATADVEFITEYDPKVVQYVPGAVGFEFIKIAEIDTGDEISTFVLNRDQRYFWGFFVNIYQLSESPYFASIIEQTDADEFCLTSWGGLIPLDEDDSVVPYPEMFELPADLTM